MNKQAQVNSITMYWANICVLNRMEREKMDNAIVQWEAKNGISPRVIYLGDTEEVQMYEQLTADINRGELGFDCIVSSRFDIFCSQKYLQRVADELVPIATLLPLREEIRQAGIPDPSGLFYPLVVLPHVIVCNRKLLKENEMPETLADLLDPYWAGKIYTGSTELPSAKSFLLAMWYKFGDAGLETCVKNWRQVSAPAACRHGLLKDEFPIGLLPGIFTSPGPEDKLISLWPSEGAPILPSYTAVKKSEHQEETIDFIRISAASPEFISFYKEQALAYPCHPSVEPPEGLAGRKDFFFPDWKWILEQDMEYFEEACKRVLPG